MSKTLWQQVGMRIKAVREVVNLSTVDFAKSINLDSEIYLKYENGQVDIPVNVLFTIANKYNVEITTLLTGIEPHLKRIAIVKKGKDLAIERRKEYKYQDLALNFVHKKAEFFLVTVESLKYESKHMYSHSGQEFNYILEGALKVVYDGSEYILEAGDSVYFDSGYEHAMFALNGKSAKFLCVIL
ncbi:MAG: cupin domain-containing protein [Endomicrobium sp.]|jgi:quercetin dioxygenase-like cupin family protein/DNA-binding XRE family transcriptional regulator|nr:cupin domain-containing protein [Endomicrobium sp.]